MAKADVLARVKQDLALGHTYTATQRLRTLVAIDPDDLDLRRMLAEVYRQTGNQVEAGRWAFLTDDVTDAELVSFERANPDPWLRMRILRWEGEAAAVPDPLARARWQALAAAAAEAGPPSAYAGPVAPPRRRGRFLGNPAVPCLFVLIALGGIAGLVTIGVIRLIAWLAGG